MAGVYHSQDDVKQHIQVKDVFDPDKTLTELYLPFHNIYESLYCHLKDAFGSLANITQGGKDTA